MTDEGLRDRVAAALDCPWVPQQVRGLLADAVIARLGLRQEWMIPDDRGPGVQYVARKPACRSRTRWVTEWVDDE